MRLSIGRYRTLVFVLLFIAVWTQRNNISSFVAGFLEGYEENQSAHLAD